VEKTADYVKHIHKITCGCLKARKASMEQFVASSGK
jgi:hypothetical protein